MLSLRNKLQSNLLIRATPFLCDLNRFRAGSGARSSIAIKSSQPPAIASTVLRTPTTLAAAASTSMANSKLFREYIGAQGARVTFADVPIDPNVEFHFILAFAVDYTTTTSPPSYNNGQFDIFWDQENLSPSHVKSIKKAHPNVKVFLSLGGDSVGGEDNHVYFSPSSLDIDSWVSNAVSSLREIIEVKYDNDLDGIDIDYEHFKKNDPETFAKCIGQLITKLKETTLKNKKKIILASIAPFEDAQVQSHYQALWNSYGRVIDFVNFQFYAHPPIETEDEFVKYFDEQSSKYKEGKVLASFTTGNPPEGQGGLLPGDKFFKACRRLKDKGKLHGIFVWSADSSYRSKSFRYEKESQEELLTARSLY